MTPRPIRWSGPTSQPTLFMLRSYRSSEQNFWPDFPHRVSSLHNLVGNHKENPLARKQESQTRSPKLTLITGKANILRNILPPTRTTMGRLVGRSSSRTRRKMPHKAGCSNHIESTEESASPACNQTATRSPRQTHALSSPSEANAFFDCGPDMQRSGHVLRVDGTSRFWSRDPADS